MDFGLEDVIRLSADTPALDPIIVDCTRMNKQGFIQKVYDVVQMLNFRMFNIGVFEFRRAFIAKKSTIDIAESGLCLSVMKIDSIPSELVGTNAYILTRSVNDEAIVHPPFHRNQISESQPSYMSWGEYFSLIARDKNPGKIIVRMPHLQAKFMDVLI